MIIAQRGTFIKKDGAQRQMNFVQLKNLPDGFVNGNTTGTGTAAKLSEGLELVWDLEANGFRVFNWNTTVGDVVEYEAIGTRISDKNEKNTSENVEVSLDSAK